MNRILIAFILVCLASCGAKDRNTRRSTWFCGVIENPAVPYVVLKSGGVLLDTVRLNGNNFFNYKLNITAPTFLEFYNKEFQALYITPGDSLIMHLDVKAFDESINYSGTGAGKNNLLMHYFLQGEKDAKNMAAYPGVRPLSFLAKLDSLKNDKQKAFARYEQKNEVAPAFGTIIPALIEAERVGLKEMYIAAKYRETNRTAATVGLPPELYVHRENFPYNTPFFAHYFPFVRVADAYFDNLAFENHRTQQAYDRTSFVHNYKKLELLDSLMDNGLLK
ncbi:MAG: hypothetical protein ACPGQR_09695, partial [Marinirhabdus sp.]